MKVAPLIIIYRFCGWSCLLSESSPETNGSLIINRIVNSVCAEFNNDGMLWWQESANGLFVVLTENTDH